jgi:putative membrane protein
MIGPVVVAWIHYIGIMLIIASLLGEHLLLKQDLTMSEARTLQRLDTVYGAAATLVLITGVMRMYLEKGVSYYLHNGAFHALLGLFIAIGLLSIYPTMIFLRWRGDTRAGRGQQLPSGQFTRLRMILRVEMTLLLLAPLFAAAMAHGLLSFH